MLTKDILERLIAFETISRKSNMALIEYVRSLLLDVGAEVILIKNKEGSKANLYAAIGEKNRPGVLLSGHTDVVPVDGQDWSFPPFKLIEKNERLYGRGSADMKGFLASALQVALNAARRKLKTPLHLAFSYDEEIGCVGVHSLIEMLNHVPFKPFFCIVGEPTGMTVATGHKGKLAGKAICTGLEAHSALAPFGLNAIYLATDFINGLRSLQEQLVNEGLPDEGFDVSYTTIHVGKIQGGVALNIVPNKCLVDFEIRNIATDDSEKIFERIKEIAQGLSNKEKLKFNTAEIGIEITNRYPGLDTKPDSEVVKFVKKLTNSTKTSKVSFGTEGGLFREKGNIPTVICGPGSMQQGHKPDEFVTNDQLEKCDTVLLRLVNQLEQGV